MLNEAEKRAVKLVYLIWKNIDFENMKKSRLLGIWEEFENKIKFAALNGPNRFLEVICKRLQIGVPKQPEILVLIDNETINVLKKNSKMIVTTLRKMIEIEKEKVKTTEEKKIMREYVEKLIAEMEQEFEKEIGGMKA